MEKKIYLIRHGKINIGNKKKYIGLTDLPLDSYGIEQSKAIRDYLYHVPLDSIYTSPLKRCIQTLNIILERKSQDYIIEDAFREINMGKWENKTFEYIMKMFPNEYEERGRNLDYFIPPDGESFGQLERRVLPALDKILRSDSKTIMIVAHAGVNRVIISKLLDISLNNLFKIEQPYGCINELTFKDKSKKWQYRRLL